MVVKMESIKGYGYVIKEHNLEESKWYSGYIKLKNNSRFIEYKPENIPISCIGGITYKKTTLNQTWIGFDTVQGFSEGVTVEDVEKECEHIINQLIELEG